MLSSHHSLVITPPYLFNKHLPKHCKVKAALLILMTPYDVSTALLFSKHHPLLYYSRTIFLTAHIC